MRPCRVTFIAAFSRIPPSKVGPGQIPVFFLVDYYVYSENSAYSPALLLHYYKFRLRLRFLTPSNAD